MKPEEKARKFKNMKEWKEVNTFSEMEEKIRRDSGVDCLKGMIHLAGIPFISGKECDIYILHNSVCIKEVKIKRKGFLGSERTYNKKYVIKFDKIIDIKIKNETEITHKEKKILGRAITGGVLFGGAGAVVGALSAPQRKEYRQKLFFIIEYSTKEEENKQIIFADLASANYSGLNSSSEYLVRNKYDNFIKEIIKIKNPNKSDNDYVEL